jgi:F1F0 ATPase subunit 2
MIDLIAVRIVSYATLGALFALVHFSVLGWNVRLYVNYGAGWNALFVHLTRLAAVAVVFAFCARQGALPLLSSLLGFQMARTTAVNRQRRALENIR